MGDEVTAVIATYCPPPGLGEHVGTVREMVRTVVVADDASPCTFDHALARTFRQPGVLGTRFTHNAGIARSLNAGLSEAISGGSQWLLTLDQDSRCSTTYVQDLLSDLQRAEEIGLSVGVIAPQSIDDKRGTIRYPINREHGWPVTEEVLQSGALWSVPLLQEVGGFDEVLGMDAVDAAACLSIRERGHDVVLSPRARLQHEWGNAHYVSLFGRTIAATGHSSQRRANIVRNRLRLFPRELRQSPTHALRTLRRVAVSNLLTVTKLRAPHDEEPSGGSTN